MTSQICESCNIDLPIVKFEKMYYKSIKKSETLTYYRKKCVHCRVKQNKIRDKEMDGHRRRYWAMSEDKRKEYIKKKSLQNSKRKDITEKRRAYNKSDKGIFLSYIHECGRRARLTRGIKMELEFDHFCVLINSQCHYCGSPSSRGVDRVDSSLSYTKPNSVPCCRICNTMKSDLTLEEFKNHVFKIVNKVG